MAVRVRPQPEYGQLETAAERTQFLADYPAMMENPRNTYLKAHPETNAMMANWGTAKLLTQQAYDRAVKLAEELQLPASAIEDYLPPKEVAKASFE